MTALTTRDALAKALHGRFSDFALLVTWDELTEAQRGTWLDDADALLASGVVVDAATLADDDALVRQINHPGRGVQLFGGVHPLEIRDVLRGLSTALSERSPR